RAYGITMRRIPRCQVTTPTSRSCHARRRYDCLTTDRQHGGSITGVFFVLAVAVTGSAMLMSGIIPALPEVIRDFDTDAAGGAWVLTSVLLSAGASTVLFGRAADLWG